jgi:hypothetical protein
MLATSLAELSGDRFVLGPGAGTPTAVSADPATALELASWWVSFHLVSMGPLYRKTLLDSDTAVPSRRSSTPIPPRAPST